MQSEYCPALTLSLYCEKLPQVLENQGVHVFHILVETEVHGDPPRERGQTSSALEEVTGW